MTTLHTLLLVAHVIIALLIIGLVMLQRGKGADAGAGFGAGASGTVFGAKGSANFLSRSTAVLATLFFVSSITLAYLGGQRRPVESLLDSVIDTDPDQALIAPTPGNEVDLDGLPGLADDAAQNADSADLPAPEAPAIPDGSNDMTDSEGTGQ